MITASPIRCRVNQSIVPYSTRRGRHVVRASGRFRAQDPLVGLVKFIQELGSRSTSWAKRNPSWPWSISTKASEAPKEAELSSAGFDVQEGYSAFVLTSIDQVNAGEWNELVQAQAEYNPFVSHEFLDILERSKSVNDREGWCPRHLILTKKPENGTSGTRGQLVGAVPLYLKDHSYGEYVFDGSWAYYAAVMDKQYYPKLQGCVPFSPVPGPRLLVRAGEGEPERAQLMRALGTALTSLTERLDLSSVHLTFNTPEEVEALEACGFMTRLGIQYHWENPGYKTFDDFLLALRQSKRKSIKQERKGVTLQNLRVSRLTGDELKSRGPELWDRFFVFYEDTVDRKWGSAYLTPAFFRMLGEKMPDKVLLVVAEEEKDGKWELVAGSLNLVGSDALFGRNWGCRPGTEYKHLHFELCYYQAIDEAIARGLPRVEAGAQGQHKLQRGYLPNLTYSSHYIRDPVLKIPIEKFLRRDQSAIATTCAALCLQASPFKAEKTAELVAGKFKELASRKISAENTIIVASSASSMEDEP